MPAALTKPAWYAGYRFPIAVIHHALWLMNRFNLSLRTVQEMLLERGIEVSHETLREWNLKFAAYISLEIKRRRGTPGKTWHLDEMRVVVRGKVLWLWRAVDERGTVLDILLQDDRDTDAAKRFFTQLLEGLEFVPEKIVTDQLGSYKAVKEVPALEGVKHVFVKSEARLNNRIERDHEHVREKQRSSRGGDLHRINSRSYCGAGISRGTCSKGRGEQRGKLE
ncbi:MAG: IS6 family transposase [Pleurocapsa sp. SU_196_0]|nr:IS6 family transposase [Pleurocapsa sp. SU_196_0]